MATRAYHSINTKYNVLFNGSESYKKGVKKIEQSNIDDFSRILPVFIYPDEKTAGTVASDMDRTTAKSSKAITLHSIKTKPLYKQKILTQRQKEFLNKKEYNWFIDDCYLYIGKAHFYKREFPAAYETFSFVSKNFPEKKSHFEAEIWLARTCNETGDYRESEKALLNLTGNSLLPKSLNAELNSSLADLYLKQKQYANAIPYLLKALKKTYRKQKRIRYTYILAQLYQITGDPEKAFDYFRKVIKMNPPYEMTFNAKINRAVNFENGKTDSREVRSQLKKMLKDEKNREFQDQVYYALANIDFKENKLDDAIANYKKSVTISVSNNNQKAVSCLSLADIYYGRLNYLPAAAYYDSAVMFLNPAYPDYNKIVTRAKCLTRLATDVHTVQLEDSLQKVAKMSESERLALIDREINKVRADEQKMQDEENTRRQAMYEDMQNINNSQTTKSLAGKWYFYSPTALGLGMSEFQNRWGKRKLEDNWRRKNKSITSISPEEGNEETSDKAVTQNTVMKTAKKKVLSNTSRDFYLQNIPLTDSMMALSNNKILYALYAVGDIYRDELNDTGQAAKAYEDLVRRFPKSDLALPTYYKLYSLYKSANNPAKADLYKNLIITQFSDSKYAHLITNPNYLKEIEAKENEVDKFYQETYDLYQKEQYSGVIANAGQAETRFKDHPLIDKFRFLKALSLLKTSDMNTFRASLNSLASSAKDSSVRTSAEKTLYYLDNQFPVIKEEEDKKVAEEIYKFNLKEKHYLGIVINRDANSNQLTFNLINFNLDKYSNENYTVSTDNLDRNSILVTVKSFDDGEKCLQYFDQVSQNTNLYKDVNQMFSQVFVISETNYNTLIHDKSAGKYIIFFKKNYKR